MRKLLTIAFLWALASPLWAQEQAVPELIFSTEGGYYDTTFAVSLYYPASHASIYYTLDGSLPQKNGKRYDSPIQITESTSLRAAVLHEEDFGTIYTHTYLINEPASDLPTLTLSIDPKLLFDSEQGLFMLGSQANLESMRMSDANFWSRREVPAHLEFYESDGSCQFNSPLGFRLFGGMSRLFPQKSIALVTRDAYGKSRIKHPIFGKKGPKSFKHLVLRNAGSDFGKAHVRDALVTQQVKNWEVDVQAYQPAQVYINGKYWGLYNIREKINRHFLASHHDIDKDSLDLLEHNMTLKRGSRRHYQRLIRHIEQHDLSQAEHYKQVEKWMDIESFIDFQIAQIFFDNRDAGGNIRYWRPQTAEGRWRWILFDMDWAMGLHNHDAYDFNSLLFHTRPDGPAWPNPPWSTYLLRSLLENPGFRQKFITRFSNYLNQELSAAALLASIDKAEAQLDGEIDRHLERWNLGKRTWERHFDRMRTFAERRPEIMRQHLQDYFELEEMYPIRLALTQGGQVQVNHHFKIQEGQFSGDYPPNYPIHLLAIPNLGYRFLYWENADGERITSAALLESISTEDNQYKAIFERYKHPMAGSLVINELMPTGKPTKDWIELFNASDKPLLLEDYILSDQKGNRFIFPKNTSIGPHDYLIVCQDKERFLKQHPMAYNVIADLSFGLNKNRESIALFDNQQAMIDSVGYHHEATDVDFSWSLILPRLDNTDPENWQLIFGPGTPGAANPYYAESKIQTTQSQWMKFSLGLGVFMLLASLIYQAWVRAESS